MLPFPQPICKLNGEDSEGLEKGEATKFLEIVSHSPQPTLPAIPTKFLEA